MPSSKKTAAPTAIGNGGRNDDTKRGDFLSHVSTRNASHMSQDKGFFSNGIKQEVPLTALLKRAIAVAERQDGTVGELASLSLQYAGLMNRHGDKEITLQGWPCGSWWMVIQNRDGGGSLEYRGSFADAYKLALLHSVYGGDDVRGAPISIAAGCP